MTDKKKISISIDKAIYDKMDLESVNKSKLINRLLSDFLKDESKLKKFKIK